MDAGVRVHGVAKGFALAPLSDGDVLFGDGEHAARAAAGVVDAEHHPLGAQPFLVAGQQQVDHEMDHVAGGEVLAGVLFQRLVELPDELLEDGAHGEVVDRVRVEIHLRIAEPLHHLEQETRLVELGDGVVEVELLQHLAHVGAEPGDVVAQILRDVGGVGQQLGEVVAGRVVEGESGGGLKQPLGVLDLVLVPGLDLHHLQLAGGQHAVEPAQHGERQNHVLVLPTLEGVPNQVRHTPDEADDLAVIHVGSNPKLTFVGNVFCAAIIDVVCRSAGAHPAEGVCNKTAFAGAPAFVKPLRVSESRLQRRRVTP